MNEMTHSGRTRNIPSFISPSEGVVIWQNLFTEEECDNIIAIGELGEFMKGRVGSHGAGENNDDVRDSDITWIEPNDDTTWIFDRLAELVAKVNYDKFQLDLTRFDGFQFSVYNPDQHYTWHVDTQALPREDGSFRKLSMSLMLSNPDEYEGGELGIADAGSTEHPKLFKHNKGTVIFFYSFVPHIVQPVTEGKRMALVTWAMGPKFV